MRLWNGGSARDGGQVGEGMAAMEGAGVQLYTVAVASGRLRGAAHLVVEDSHRHLAQALLAAAVIVRHRAVPSLRARLNKRVVQRASKRIPTVGNVERALPPPPRERIGVVRCSSRLANLPNAPQRVCRRVCGRVALACCMHDALVVRTPHPLHPAEVRQHIRSSPPGRVVADQLIPTVEVAWVPAHVHLRQAFWTLTCHKRMCERTPS
jgi:hypothetical protein